MKYLVAFITPDLRQRVLDALAMAHVSSVSISETYGFGQEHDKDRPEDHDHPRLTMTKRLRLEIFCESYEVEELFEAVHCAAHASFGRDSGDGKVFVMDLEDAYRVSTGQRGGEVLRASHTD